MRCPTLGLAKHLESKYVKRRSKVAVNPQIAAHGSGYSLDRENKACDSRRIDVFAHTSGDRQSGFSRFPFYKFQCFVLSHICLTITISGASQPPRAAEL